MKKIYILLITLLLCFEGWGQTDSYIYTQTEKGFSKINAQNGQIIWTNSSIYLYPEDKPTLKNGIIILNAGNGISSLSALQESNGNLIWSLNSAGTDYYDYYDTQPVIFKNTVIITTAKYDVYCYDLTTGKELWKYKNTKWSRIYSFTVDTENLYIYTWGPHGNGSNNSVAIANAMNASTGKLIWEDKILAISHPDKIPPKIFGGKLLIQDGAGLVELREAKTGKIIWKYDYWERAAVFDIVDIDESGNFYAVATNQIIQLNPQNGKLLNTFPKFSDRNLIGDGYFKIKNGVGYFSAQPPTGGLGKTLYALDLKNGSIKWTYKIVYNVIDLTVTNNSVYIFRVFDTNEPNIVVLGLDGSNKWSLSPNPKYGGSSFCVLDNKTYLYNSYFNGNIDGYTAPTLTQSTLTLSATEQNAVATATTANITLSTNNTWTASSNATWLKVNTTSGNAGTNIAIKCTIDANTTATARTGVVTFTSGGLTKTYTVTQAGTNGTGLNIDRGINIISPKTNDYFFAANYIPVKAELKESTLGVGFKVGLYPSGSDVPIETSVKIIKISQLSDFTLDLPSTLPNGKYEIRIVNFSNNSINGKVLVEIGNKPDECASQPLNIVNSRKGITIITHGFTPGGEKYGDISSWTDYAKKIRKKISSSNYVDGKGAVIYKNNNDTGIWEKMKIPANEGGNGNVTFDNNGNIDNEIILIYDWKGYSHKPFIPIVRETGIQTGYLEAAADNLFRLLVDSHSDDGKLTGKYIIEKLPVHIIAHSRGNIMMLQTLHRIGKYFPKIIIEQFTALDPHPATSFGDVAYKQAGTVSSLPGLTNKIVDGCKYTIGCGDAMDIQLLMPFNVKYAENYFRRDGIYEGSFSPNLFSINNNWPVFLGSFDGIPVDGIKANNELDDIKIASYSGRDGGAHSGIVNWYFGTLINEKLNDDEFLNNKNIIDWYGSKGALKNNPKCRFLSGYYFSRNGGASDAEMSNLKPFKTISIDEMDKQLEKRPRCYNDNCTSRPLTQLGILNGNFEYGNNSGWWGNGGNLWDKSLYSIINKDNSHNYALYLGDVEGSNNNYSATHSSLYFPANFNYLEMSILMDDDSFSRASTENIFKVTFYDKFNKEYVGKTLKIPADNLWHKYSFEIPNELEGKSGRFKVELVSNKLTTNFINSNQVLVDDIQFSNFKQSGLIINENTKESITLFPNPTTNQFSIDLKDIEGKAQSLTIIDEKGTIIAQKAIDETCCENIQVDFPQTGVYSIIIQTDKGTVSKKLSVNK